MELGSSYRSSGDFDAAFQLYDTQTEEGIKHLETGVGCGSLSKLGWLVVQKGPEDLQKKNVLTRMLCLQ